MDGEYRTAGQGTAGLALQDNVMQGRQGRACKCKAGLTLHFYGRGWQSEILKIKFHVFILSKISTYYVW